MALAAGLSLWWLRGVTFTIDELGYLVGRRQWDATTLLEPHNGHLVLAHLLVFKTSLEVFGASSHLPFTLLTVAAQLAVGGLVYTFASRPLGPLGALVPALPVLFLGSGWEVMMNPAGLSNQIALVAGLGALLCLGRGDRGGDVGACLLLGLALASHTLGLAFAAALATEVLVVGRAREWRRLWIVAAPVLLYAVWALWATRFDQAEPSSYAVGSLGSGAFDVLAASCSAIAGLFRQAESSDLVTGLVTVDADRGAALAVLLAAAFALRASRLPRLSARAWAIAAALGAYLLLVALGLREGRPAEASRYAYTGGVLVALLAAQLCEGLRLRRGWAIAASAIVALSVLANGAQMRDAGTFFRTESEYDRAETAALEAGRRCIPPGFEPESKIVSILPHRDMYFSAAEYYATVDAYGSPAFSPDQLAAASPEARAAAATLLSEALGRRTEVGASPLPPAGRLCPSASPPGRR